MDCDKVSPVSLEKDDTLAQAVDLLQALAGHCTAVIVGHGPAVASLFVTGLVGSLSHCTGMCGPLVAAQSAERLGRQQVGPGADWRRLVGAALLPYQLGRMTTYMGLGALLALPVGLAAWGSFWWAGPLLLAAAAVLFLFQALHGLGIRWPIPADRRSVASGNLVLKSMQRGFSTLLSWGRPLFRHPIGWRGYGLGLLLGFLPCGLLYAALAAAAATGDSLAAAIGMSAFMLGTFPISWVIGYGSAVAAGRWRSLFRRLLPILAIFNAIGLLALAFDQVMSA